MALSEDLLQLLHQWLGCDEKAGRQLWFDSGLFFEWRRRAIGVGRAHAGDVRRRGMRINLTQEDMEEEAGNLLLIIHSRLKPHEPGKPGKTPGDFSVLAQFYGYLNESLNGIRDIINKRAFEQGHIDSIEKLLSTGGEQQDERTIGDTIAADTASPEDEVISRDRQRKTALCLRAFRSELEERPAKKRKRALERHFDALVEAFKEGKPEVTLEMVAEEVIEFFWSQAIEETVEQHRPIRDYLRAKEETDAQYDTYNRRLRHQWRIFREGPGQNVWRQFEETLR